jgi:hypothetical protein
MRFPERPGPKRTRPFMVFTAQDACNGKLPFGALDQGPEKRKARSRRASLAFARRLPLRSKEPAFTR